MPNEARRKTAVKAADVKHLSDHPAASVSEQAKATPYGIKTQDRERQRFLENLYSSYWTDLCNWLRRRYGAGPPEPEDIAQTAFEKIAALKDISHIRYPKTFLYSTAINTALTAISWLARTRRFVDDELKQVTTDVDEFAPDRVYLAKEELDRVMERLDRLSPKHKEIVIRSRFLGQTHREITEETGWSNADISRHLMAALTEMEDVLNKSDATDREN